MNTQEAALLHQRNAELEKALAAKSRDMEIEAALERVRSRAMTMHHSDELAEAANLLFLQVQALGVPVLSCGYNIWEKEETVCMAWMSDQSGLIQQPFKLPLMESPTFIRFYKSKQSGEQFYTEEVNGEALAAHYRYMITLPGFGKIVKGFEKAGFTLPAFQVNNVVNFSHGNLVFITYQPIPEAHDIFKRFGKVFEQTYTRFLDLQRAEAQAREAQIEAALERVRSHSLAVYKSNEFNEVIKVLFERLQALEIPMTSVSINVFIEGSKDTEAYICGSVEDGLTLSHIRLVHFNHPIANDRYNAYENGLDFFSKTYSVEEKNSFFEYEFEVSDLKYIPANLKKMVMESEHYNCSVALNKNSMIVVNDFEGKSLSSQQINIVKRFSRVFEQAYIRFLDLQKAEAAAREARIEAALERVRSRSMAMYKSNEVMDVAVTVYDELQKLDFKFGAATIIIMDEKTGNMEHWLAGFLQKNHVESYQVNNIEHPLHAAQLAAWRKGEKFVSIELFGTALADYAKEMFTQTGYQSLPDEEKAMLSANDHAVFNLAYMSHGALMWAPSALSDEKQIILQRFAKVFEQTYTRFLDLQKAEALVVRSEQDLLEIKAARKKAEDTLTELQATQAQLIQSEKMASLGELTAGIAHEIQNPLNFVNNFSEVSKELLTEMRQELKAGNPNEAIAIADDLEDNLEKINHHGKRADAIVKSMLQHSRVSTGKKEPTDINALADEYLRLSYHGFRAKDKSFNATIETHFDESIGKIEVVPQDIGRVLLNLFNNAFYAVTEKNKVSGESYKPVVFIQTKKFTGKIEVKVSDNGTGIPQKNIDKIFQPFFTTKPTGEGTGLGLSLSYDIIKAHDGELKVESKEGEGTTFLINLPMD